MTETFHQAVCPDHEFKGETFQRQAFAQIEADTHGQIKPACDAAYVREFEAAAIGTKPRDVPSTDFETDEEVQKP